VGLEKLLSIGEIIDKYYGDITEAFNEEITKTLPEHRPYDCKIELEPDALLYKGAIYLRSPREEKALKEYIDENLAKGFIRRSESPADYFVLFVFKKSEELRLCMDYRKLNQWAKRNAYPIPRISAVFEAMKEAVVISSLNDVFSEDIRKYCQVYLDDTVVYSKTLEEHVQHVRTNLKKLIKHKLVANISKCELHKLKISFLGHMVSKDGVETDPEKIKAVAEWPQSENVKQMQSFLGFCKYYRNYIRNFSEIAKPLFKMTSRKEKFEWTKEGLAAFHKLKEMFTPPPVLAYPNHECDASNYSIVGVLM